MKGAPSAGWVHHLALLFGPLCCSSVVAGDVEAGTLVEGSAAQDFLKSLAQRCFPPPTPGDSGKAS